MKTYHNSFVTEQRKQSGSSSLELMAPTLTRPTLTECNELRNAKGKFRVLPGNFCFKI